MLSDVSSGGMLYKSNILFEEAHKVYSSLLLNFLVDILVLGKFCRLRLGESLGDFRQHHSVKRVPDAALAKKTLR